MSTRELAIEVQNVSGSSRIPSEQLLRAWALAAFTASADARWARAGARRPTAGGELTIRIVGERESADLNRATAASAARRTCCRFGAEPPPGDAGAELLPLGDLVICAAVVAREAREQGKTARCALGAHGRSRRAASAGLRSRDRAREARRHGSARARDPGSAWVSGPLFEVKKLTVPMSDDTNPRATPAYHGWWSSARPRARGDVKTATRSRVPDGVPSSAACSRRRARDAAGRARSRRHASARHHGAAQPHGRVVEGRVARRAPQDHHRVEPLALPGDRRRSRRGRRHRAREGHAEALRRRRPRAVPHRAAAAPRRLHSREQASEHAARGVPRRPQPHGDRRRRVRRRVRPRDDRGRARADRRRDRRRARSARKPRRSSRRTAAASSCPALTRIEEFNDFFSTRVSATRSTTPSAAS